MRVQQPNSGLGHFIVKVSRSHTIRHTHTHPVELLSTSDQLVVEAITYSTHNKHKRQTSMSLFDPAIPGCRPTPQTVRSPG